MSKRPLSPRFQRIVDRVRAEDRAYFAQHPNARTYYRDYVPGEFGPMNDPLPRNLVIAVEQLAPGVRVRRPAFLAFELPPRKEPTR